MNRLFMPRKAQPRFAVLAVFGQSARNRRHDMEADGWRINRNDRQSPSIISMLALHRCHDAPGEVIPGCVSRPYRESGLSGVAGSK